MAPLAARESISYKLFVSLDRSASFPGEASLPLLVVELEYIIQTNQNNTILHVHLVASDCDKNNIFLEFPVLFRLNRYPWLVFRSGNQNEVEPRRDPGLQWLQVALLSIYLSICLSLSIYLSIYLSFYLSIYLCISPSVYLQIYLSRKLKEKRHMYMIYLLKKIYVWNGWIDGRSFF